MIQLNWHTIILLIGFVQGLFVAFALWTKQANNLANRFLALFVLIQALLFADLFLDTSNLMIYYPNILNIVWPPSFALGPLLVWYTRSLTDKKFVFNKRELRHLFPIPLSIIPLLPFIVLNSDLKRAFILDTIDEINYTVPIFGLIIVMLGLICHSGIYIFWSLRCIHRHNSLLPQQFSFDEDINLRWLKRVAIIFFMVWLLYLLSIFSSSEEATIMFTLLFEAGLIINVFTIGFFATRQSLVLSTEPTTSLPDNQGEQEPEKYQSSSLSEAQAKAIEKKLLTHMKVNKPYSAGKLTLPQLATQLDVLPNYLSQVINERFNCNFFDFINQYRIAEAKRLLLDKPDYKILDIALDSGFNSKSAFYKVFKQQCHTTPTQFRKSHSKR